MFRLDGGRPGDARGFLHKSLIGRAVGGVAKRVISATPIGAAITTGLGIARGFGRRAARPVAPRTTTARPSFSSSQGKETGRELKFGGADTRTAFPALAPSPFVQRLPFVPGCDNNPGESDRCCRLRNGDFNDQRRYQLECTGIAGTGTATGVGAAVMGRYGAALEPGVMMIERSVCLPGMNLGNDGLCYNKGAITNKQRQWPRGRRPLLTGGDMRAIGIAARAGSKLDRTTKRLRALGLMKALPKGRGTRAHAHAKPVAAVSVPS